MARLREQIDEYNRCRRELGEPLVTQRSLAHLAGVHEVTVLRHVAGTTAMSLDQAIAYARVLRCSLEDLAEADHEVTAA